MVGIEEVGKACVDVTPSPWILRLRVEQARSGPTGLHMVGPDPSAGYQTEEQGGVASPTGLNVIGPDPSTGRA